ncbi:TPA: hypothetical protein K8071_000501 [Staphylococcus pseudintermedius]|nr:hypothetical protein [Staphylococcus pseudintermedius]
MEKRVKKNNNWKFLLSKEEIETMRKGVFRESNSHFKIVISKEFMTYLEGLDTTNAIKAKVLLLYVGIILVYKEASYTYRRHHINLEIICQFLGIKYSEKLRKLFSNSSYLVENQFIGTQYDFPVEYSVSYVEDKEKRNYFGNYTMFKSLSKDEKEKMIDANRLALPVRSIEPIRHTKGVFRKNGQEMELVKPPIDIQGDKYITITYKSLFDTVKGNLSVQSLYLACVVKDMLSNKITTRYSRFKVNKNSLAKKVGASLGTFKKQHRELKSYTNQNYRLEQFTTKRNGEFVSEVFLFFDSEF